MISKYVINAIFEFEFNALREELCVCLDAQDRAKNEEDKSDAEPIIDKLLYAISVIGRIYEEIKKL